MSGIYDLTLQPGAADRIPALGELCKIIGAPSGGVTVSLDFGEQIALMEGQGVRKPDGKPFRDVLIRNRAALAQTITVFIGDSRFEDSRISGTVSIIDSAKDRTRSGLAFADWGFVIAAAAAQYGQLCIWNPAGSGKRLVVNRVVASVSLATNINWGFVTVQPATLRNAVKSKLQGGAAGSSQVRTDSTVGIPFATAWMSRPVLASTPTNFDFREPLVVGPGAGVSLFGDPQGTAFALFADFDMVEEVAT